MKNRILTLAAIAVTGLAVTGCETTGPATNQVQDGSRMGIDDTKSSADVIAAQIAADLETRLLPKLDEQYTYDMYIAPFRNLDSRTSTSEFDLVMRRIRRSLMNNETFLNKFNVFEAPRRMVQIAAAQQVGSSDSNPFEDQDDIFLGRDTHPNYVLVLAGTATPIRRPDGALYDVEVNITRVGNGEILYIGDFSVQYGNGAQ